MSYMMKDPGSREKNWDDEEYYEFLLNQYEQEQEEEDIMGDIEVEED